MQTILQYSLLLALWIIGPVTLWGGNPKLDLYLLIGQSNMAGRGYLTDEYMDEMENVYLLTPDGQMEPARNPLNKYSSIRKDMKHQQLGPGYSFARAVVEETGHPIGLIVNAKGGSSINSWLKGAKDDFYGEAIRRVKEAQEWGELKAILWHQGESDRKDPKYMEKLSQLVSDLRTDIGNDSLLFVAGEIAHWGGESAINFNNRIRMIEDFIPHSACVSAEGLTPLIDEKDPHFSAEAQIELGKRYAEVVVGWVVYPAH